MKILSAFCILHLIGIAILLPTAQAVYFEQIKNRVEVKVEVLRAGWGEVVVDIDFDAAGTTYGFDHAILVDPHKRRYRHKEVTKSRKEESNKDPFNFAKKEPATGRIRCIFKASDAMGYWKLYITATGGKSGRVTKFSKRFKLAVTGLYDKKGKASNRLIQSIRSIRGIFPDKPMRSDNILGTGRSIRPEKASPAI